MEHRLDGLSEETGRGEAQDMSEVWKKRWRGAAGRRAVTPLGKWMFRSKSRALRKILGTVSVRTAIEIGCGFGYTLSAIRKAGIDAVGIDISPEAVSACARQGLPVRQKDLAEVEERYDLVSSDGLLEHFLNFQPVAERLMGISREYVLLIQPNHDSLAGKILALLAEILRRGVNVHEYNYRIRDFVGVFERGGFRLVRNVPVFADVFRLLVFRKDGSP